ncbi:MAG: DNA-binding transcriptional MerR regulator [Pseudohongiellaceae bacterium]|jgi:DNA-binding transcriptional MerR regulator
MVDESQTIHNKFPIRELSARTQVNTVTLRAWERRYGLLKPERTAKGHRLYSESDVSTIERILALVARGVPLGKVKPLLHGDMPASLQDDDAENWLGLVAELIESIEQFSVSKVERLISESYANYPAPICRECMIEPVFLALAIRNSKGAAYGFAESELIRYVLLRLSAKISKKKGAVEVILMVGTQAPIWRLALMALELKDAKFSVHLINRAFSVSALIDLAAKSKNAYTVFYQDGVWKDKEKEQVTTALLENDQLFMCGTAPILSHLDSGERVFSDVKSCITGLLKLQ